MRVPRSDSNNVCPLAHITLTVIIITTSNNSAVRFQPNSMPSTGSDSNNVCPTDHVTLTVNIIADGNNSTIGF